MDQAVRRDDQGAALLVLVVADVARGEPDRVFRGPGRDPGMVNGDLPANVRVTNRNVR